MGVDGTSLPVRALLANTSGNARIGEKKNWRLPFASLPPLQNFQREGDLGLAGGGAGAQRRGHPEFLLPWKRRIPTPSLSNPSGLSSFGLQLPALTHSPPLSPENPPTPDAS